MSNPHAKNYRFSSFFFENAAFVMLYCMLIPGFDDLEANRSSIDVAIKCLSTVSRPFGAHHQEISAAIQRMVGAVEERQKENDSNSVNGNANNDADPDANDNNDSSPHDNDVFTDARASQAGHTTTPHANRSSLSSPNHPSDLSFDSIWPGLDPTVLNEELDLSAMDLDHWSMIESGSAQFP